MDQQRQTRDYFHAFARDWQNKAQGRPREFNVIEARNAAVLDVLERVQRVSRFLDVGCGTGQLAIDVARRGIDTLGVDFAPDMIEIATKNAAQEKSPASFICASFFDAKPVGPYDVIGALGLIEYISLEQLEWFFSACSEALRPGGSLAVGSRNRLFNAMSLNAFTALEQRLGVLPHLIDEAVALQLSSAGDLFNNLRRHERSYAQPDSHPDTGIGVSLRYQFTPAELIHRARKHSLEPSAIYPIHFHG